VVNKNVWTKMGIKAKHRDEKCISNLIIFVKFEIYSNDKIFYQLRYLELIIS